MNDREIMRAAHEADSWLRDTVAAMDTPEHFAERLAEINANNDRRELIIADMLARERQIEGDE